ncbi:MAG: UPF0149 family protein [Gammaproteobacteria bacterium]|nr:UPF0149 family protein [Gammaproteobacteria bacterium]
MLDFYTIQNALQKLGANTDAAEAHGCLCGLLLDDADMATWLKHSLDDLPEVGDVLATEKLGDLKKLFKHSREQLDTEDLSLELLLPDETDDLSDRLLGLATWCQGFLYAIGVTGLAHRVELDEFAQECLSDLLEISKLDYHSTASEEAEQQYVEIVEHVRMSVFVLKEALNPVMPTPSLQ